MYLIDFSNCSQSDRHGIYGGQAGDKDGIKYNGEYWIVKYPKTTRSMQGIDTMSYTTSPLSEYIGSHIYKILGYSVHENLLGIRNNKLVVACKDFCKHRGDLVEMRTLKNAANRELSETLETEFHSSATGDLVSLDELLLHLEHNPILQQVADVKEHFWETSVIDVFIGNNDRNNGNWGVLYQDEGGYELAPVFDNGNSFNNKTEDNKIQALYDNDTVEVMSCGNRTAFEYNGHQLSAKKLLKLDNDDLRRALIRVVPIIEEHFADILEFIDRIPSREGDMEIISDVRRRFYKDSLKYRYTSLLLPARDRAEQVINASAELKPKRREDNIDR